MMKIGKSLVFRNLINFLVKGLFPEVITQDVLCFNRKGEADRKVIVNTYHVFASGT